MISGLAVELHVAEYFAGIGLARIGFEQAGLRVSWSNDISAKKHDMFRMHFRDTLADHTYHLGDLQHVDVASMPSRVDVAWASFPCTDLSLAGGRGGLSTGSSAAFWFFVRNLSQLGSAKPRAVALENVTGFVSSRAGRDIRQAIRALNGLGYSVDVLNIDARHFVPQSRPRLFLVGVLGSAENDPTPSVLRPPWLDSIFNDPTLQTHRAPLPEIPSLKTNGFSAIADRIRSKDERWWSADRVADFRNSLSPLQSERLDALAELRVMSYRTAFRRMRNGKPRWEVRADDIAGCLRTARGGSSRQAVVVAGRGTIRARWMTTREYAKLMGAPDYKIGGISDYAAYSGFGDAVCVPVVRWLAENCLVPAVKTSMREQTTLGYAS